MRTSFLAVLMLSFCSFLLAQQAMNNDSVIKLLKAGLSDDLIVMTINSSPGTYDTSANGLIALKNAGAGAKIIAAVVLKSAGSTKTLPAASVPLPPVPAVAPEIPPAETPAMDRQAATAPPAAKSGQQHANAEKPSVQPAQPSGTAAAPPSPDDHALALYRQCIAAIGDGSLVLFALNTTSQISGVAAPQVSFIGLAHGLEIRGGDVIALRHAIDAPGPIASVYYAGELDGKKVYYAAVKPGPMRLFSGLWFDNGTNLYTQGVTLDVRAGQEYVLGDITVELISDSGMVVGNQAGSAVLQWSKDGKLAPWFAASYLRKASPDRFVATDVPPKPILAFKGIILHAFADGNDYSMSDFRTDQELISAINDPKDDLGDRQNAIRELGNRKSKAAVSSLLKCLDDPELKIREATIEALGKIGGEDATKALKDVAAGNPDEGLRSKALQALDNIDTNLRLAAIEKLTDQAALANIAKTDKAPSVRGAAVQKLTDEALLADIKKNDGDRNVQALAYNRLIELKNEHK